MKENHPEKNRTRKPLPPPERAEELLTLAGLRVTGIRRKIIETLITEKRPLSHADIATCRQFRKLDRVTLYRNLGALESAGIIHAILGVDNIMRYCAHDFEKAGCPGDHPHFICTSCGTMICLTGQQIPRVDIPEGYSISGKRFIVYGLCEKCGSADGGGNP